MALSKVTMIIAGMLEDTMFGHVCYIASNLAETLPNFYFEKISKSQKDWELWLKRICKVHNWSHTKSPLVWREVGMRGGNATYIGDAIQFWEFVHEYYGIDSQLTKDELEALKLDTTLAHETEVKMSSSRTKKERRCIMIIGAGRSLCPDLVAQLVTIEELWLSQGVIIKLYDEPGHFFKMKDIVKDASGVGGGLCVATTVQTLRDGLIDCDILIVLEHLLREDYESSEDWLIRNRTVTLNLAEQINEYASPDTRVLFCSMGPTCFCASVLLNATFKLKKSNVVVIGAHYGLEIIYSFVTSVGVPLKEVGCPPVWGFLGVNHYVDVCHMIQVHEVYRPNNRALTLQESTLPLGTKRTELRWFFYMAHDKNPYETLNTRRGVVNYQVGRMEDYQKCKAICDLLKLWYGNEADIGNDIISLGISSDGTFGIPEGMFFSQPVYLKQLENKSRVWVPFSEFPIPNHPPWILQSLITTADIIMNKLIYLNVPYHLPKASEHFIEVLEQYDEDG